MVGALRLLQYAKATTNNTNSVIETHQSKESLNEVEMLYLNYSLTPVPGCMCRI